jgi:hypothetical protein
MDHTFAETGVEMDTSMFPQAKYLNTVDPDAGYPQGNQARARAIYFSSSEILQQLVILIHHNYMTYIGVSFILGCAFQ